MKATYEILRDHISKITIAKSSKADCSPHFHHQVELLYCIGGNYTVSINDNKFEILPNQMAISDSFDIHSYSSTDPSDCFILILPKEYIASYSNYTKNQSLSKNFICDESGDILQIVKQLDKYFKSNPLLIGGLINSLLGLIIENIPLQPNKNSRDVELIRNILTYIEDNFTDNISLESLSAYFGYSKYHFSRIFNSYINSNLNDYINLVRVKNVVFLLASGEHSITDAVFNSGFSSIRTFYRCFHEIYGISPIKYLSNNRNEALNSLTLPTKI